MKRIIFATAATALIASLTACGGGAENEAAAPATPRPTSTPSASATPSKTTPEATKPEKATATRRAATLPAFTGLGATRAAWDANHTKAPGFLDGMAYLPKVRTGGGETVPKYASVLEDAGRIIDYSINVPAGTSLSAAKAFANSELPDGMRLGKGFRQGERSARCTFFVLDNAPLKKALEALPVVMIYEFEDGIPGVEYISFTTYPSRAALKGKTC